MKTKKPDLDPAEKPKLRVEFAHCSICGASLSSALRPIDGFLADHLARHRHKEDTDEVQPLPYSLLH